MLSLPNGPWNPILTGDWGGIKVTYYENPDKEILILVFDKKGERILGVVMLLARFFIPDRSSPQLADALEGNAIYLKKKTPTKKTDYIAVVTDPVYAEFKAPVITRTFNQLWTALQEETGKLRELARKNNVMLTELKNANEEQIHDVLGEPLALPTAIIRKPGERTILEIKTGKLNLGTKLTGERAEEPVQNLILSVVTGKILGRILQVLIEESVLNGVTVVLYDETGAFENINKPNPSMNDFEKFGLSQPMGMPTRTMEPGVETFIEVNLFSGEFLADLFGLGKDCIPVLEEAMKSEPDNLEELEKAIESKTMKKYVDERVLRALKLIEREFGELFKGKNDAREILAPWLKKMGRVTYIKLSEIPEEFKDGIIYSVTKAIHRFLKSEIPKGELQSLSLVRYNPESKIFKENEKTLKVLTSYGHGVIFYSRDDLEMDEELRDNAKIKIHALDEKNAVVISHGHKEYRVKVRPTLASPASLTLQS